MALLLIKSLLMPARQRPEHSRLLETERGDSIDSGITNGFDDKLDENENGSLRCKINPRIISDATIGLSDGLTVPFALTAGLSALGTTDLVIYAGFAELVAGGISMGLGGFLGAKGESDAYIAALMETKDCVANDKPKAGRLVRRTFQDYDLPSTTLDSMTDTLLAQPDQLVDFLMRFHHQLAEADFTRSRAYACGITIASSYFLGGLVPLMPYLFFEHVRDALWCSVFTMSLALFSFGWAKTALIGESSRMVCFRNAMEMLVLGGVAAGAAIVCVRAIGG